MASVTFAVPEEVKQRMRDLSWVNWSELARREAARRLKVADDFERLSGIISKSKLTEEDARVLAKNVSKGMSKRLR